jgi:probable HAF family extracellular repeat protein
MRKRSIGSSLLTIGSLALAGAMPACGGVAEGDDDRWGVEAHDSFSDPSDGDTGAGAKRRYRVVIVDEANLTHQPTAINNRGQIAGSARNDEDVRAAWFWDGEEGHFILGDHPEGAGLATDINDAGNVAGSTLFFRDYSEMPGSFSFRTRAFVYDGTIRDFGVLDGNSQSRAEGLNRHGEVAGSSFGGTGEQHAVLYANGEILDLGLGQAFAVNDRGEVVGSRIVVDVGRAFFYSGGKVVDLGTLGGETSAALDLNEAGEIVGFSSTADGRTRAFLYRDGAMSELPVPGDGSTASAINRRGDVVGAFSFLPTPGVSDGYLYQNGQVSLLRDLVAQDGCWAHLEPRDINDRGDIVGIGIRNSGASCGESGRFLIVLTRHPKRN